MPRSDDVVAAGADRGGHVRRSFLGCQMLASSAISTWVYKHLRRLERLWIDFPIYYTTTCVRNRKSVLARDEAAQILVEEWRAARCRHGWAVGRYVIMPDHVHFFCRAELGAKSLSYFVGNWKSWTSRAINALSRPRSAPAATTLWQREFFDHIVRSNESYAEKWNYVRENPVRAGLVKSADHWPYSGEIEMLML